jgi:ABC-type glutathione transport system ATPase component
VSGETENAGEVLFQVKDLHVTYRRPGQKAVEAVRGVSFDLHAGETLGIVGESGSGKSTIAKTLMLLQPSSGGRVLFRGKDIAAFTAAERRQYRRDVQMVFQDAVGSLNPRMTIRQELEEILQKSLGGVRGRQEEEETTLGGIRGRQSPRLLSLIDIVGLSKAVLDQYPRELSGGQCQRASFARALAVNPKVLVADEPVSALDVSVQARILNLMRDLRRELGLAILLIAHDLSVVRNVCDRVCVMHRGLFEDVGPAEDVFDHPQSDYTKNLLAAVPDVRRSLSARTPQ